MVSCGISTSFPVLFPSKRKVAHALLTRPPLKQKPKSLSPLDLHVLGTPPAFVLSQDQTLAFNPLYLSGVSPARCKLIRNYCLFVCVILVLYRFQGSVLSGRLLGAARVSLYIISSPQRNVNTFLQLFSLFCASFSVCEHSSQKENRPFWCSNGLHVRH